MASLNARTRDDGVGEVSGRAWKWGPIIAFYAFTSKELYIQATCKLLYEWSRREETDCEKSSSCSTCARIRLDGWNFLLVSRYIGPPPEGWNAVLTFKVKPAR